MPYILPYRPTIFGWILRIKPWGVGLYAGHATQAYFNIATWTTSTTLGYVYVCGRMQPAVGPHTDCSCCGCIPVKSTVTWHHSNTHTVQDHRSAKPHTSCQVPRCHVHACCSCCCELVDTHYQPTDPGYSFVANFRYRLIHESLIFATISAAGMGVGLHMGQLIREYIRSLAKG